MALATSDNGAPVYLRDLADVVRSYESPARFLNYYNWRDAQGVWRRTRAVTLSAQMRSGEQIAEFGAAIDATLADLKKRLPEDLVMARTSDQPLQVRENIDLFMNSLYEAVILVVIVSLIGFWEWRSAALLDAGIMRLRPVMITVGATVFALFPLASHGGPLWEPMCYAQIGGLSVATFVTLLLVPVIYAIFVLDLKLVKWAAVGEHMDGDQEVRGDDRPIPPQSQEGVGWSG